MCTPEAEGVHTKGSLVHTAHMSRFVWGTGRYVFILFRWNLIRKCWIRKIGTESDMLMLCLLDTSSLASSITLLSRTDSHF